MTSRIASHARRARCSVPTYPRKAGRGHGARSIEHARREDKAARSEPELVLYEEVNRLPERLRVPVILSHLEGETHEQVAARLKWPVRTVNYRLSRAREVLWSRLIRRGLDLSAVFPLTALSRGIVFAEVVPAELVNRTVRAVGILCLRMLPF